MSFSIKKALLLGLSAAAFLWAYIVYVIGLFYHPSTFKEHFINCYFWAFTAVLLLNSVWFLLTKSESSKR
ncbi:conserved hypothetical protein [Roseibium sp. TrichSKD4]|nr:conserved hypothetical protein [Roseibium sp. TrichSKD4]